MAVSTEIDQIPTLVPPPEPPKRGRGRPRKEVPPPEDQEEQVQITGNDDFWLKLANFTDDDWSKNIAYLFRCAPQIDRKANGKPANIQAYGSAFTREDIMKEHGSGAYRIDLNRIDPASGKSFRYAQERFTIINPKYPPNVPPGDWVDDKSNEMWRWGIASNGTAVSTPGYPPGFSMDKMYDKAFEFAKQLNTPKDTTMETSLMLKMAELSDPARLLTLAQQLTPKVDN